MKMSALKKILHEYDPGLLALKRTLKTFLAMMVLIVIFRHDTRLAMFAAISSLLISRSQSGITINERKFTLLSTGIFIAIICIPAS
ncbi:MAG: hypothetical protein HQ536_03835, partial [Parcubacteria group bacterium]|nr:hypothetical protein [Parcubacteria group bacterium]